MSCFWHLTSHKVQYNKQANKYMLYEWLLRWLLHFLLPKLYRGSVWGMHFQTRPFLIRREDTQRHTSQTWDWYQQVYNTQFDIQYSWANQPEGPRVTLDWKAYHSDSKAHNRHLKWRHLGVIWISRWFQKDNLPDNLPRSGGKGFNGVRAGRKIEGLVSTRDADTLLVPWQFTSTPRFGGRLATELMKCKAETVPLMFKSQYPETYKWDERMWCASNGERISAPCAQMWSCQQTAASSTSSTRLTCQQLSTRWLIRLISETKTAGSDGIKSGSFCLLLSCTEGMVSSQQQALTWGNGKGFDHGPFDWLCHYQEDTRWLFPPTFQQYVAPWKAAGLFWWVRLVSVATVH